jgi:hypothetical protein
LNKPAQGSVGSLVDWQSPERSLGALPCGPKAQDKPAQGKVRHERRPGSVGLKERPKPQGGATISLLSGARNASGKILFSTIAVSLHRRGDNPTQSRSDIHERHKVVIRAPDGTDDAGQRQQIGKQDAAAIIGA